MQDSKAKIVVFVPVSHAEKVRQAMGDAGAGKIGNYSHCSFSSKGVGRFLPLEGSHPAIGRIGDIEAVEEERIEVTCDRDLLDKVVATLKKNHPYEEVAFDVYPLLESQDL